jgi:hypothetical protein
MAAEASYWMDRVKLAAPSAKRHHTVALVSVNQESRDLIAARTALYARAGLSQDELYRVARQRRRDAARANLPGRSLFALGLASAGVVLCVVGSAFGSTPALFAGFVAIFGALVVASLLLAARLDPPIGELARYLHDGEAPANADEITELSRAALADPELGRAIVNWWREGGAPIRKQDLALVQAFQRAKSGR